jgi:hypothetical protein
MEKTGLSSPREDSARNVEILSGHGLSVWHMKQVGQIKMLMDKVEHARKPKCGKMSFWAFAPLCESSCELCATRKESLLGEA